MAIAKMDFYMEWVDTEGRKFRAPVDPDKVVEVSGVKREIESACMSTRTAPVSWSRRRRTDVTIERIQGLIAHDYSLTDIAARLGTGISVVKRRLREHEETPAYKPARVVGDFDRFGGSLRPGVDAAL